MIAVTGISSTAPIVLAAWVGSIILLAVHTWCRVKGLTLSRRTTLVLNGSIGTLVVAFSIFVFISFKTLA
jgi:hypothetical protein